MAGRLNNDVELERDTALTQIGWIGGYRLADLVASPAGAEVKAMRDRLVSSATAAALLRERMLAANLRSFLEPPVTWPASSETIRTSPVC